MRNNTLSTILIAAVLSISAFSTAAVAKDKKAYYLYGDARPGSKFKQKLFKDVVPFDKRYSEMSPGLQARVKAAYGGLKDSEHPPFPTEGSQIIFRQLFKANRDLQDEGDVLAIATIDANGDAQKVTVYKAPSSNIATMLGTHTAFLDG